MMDPQELNTLVGLVKAMQPRTIFEIGTGLGMATKYVAQAAPDNSTIYTLDVKPSQLNNTVIVVDGWNREYVQHKNEDVGKAYREAGLEGKVKQLFGDSITFDFSQYSGQMDMVIVDGDRSYGASPSDLRNALKMISPNGLVVLDDYGKFKHSSGVTYAVLKEVVENGRVFYHVHQPDGPIRTGLIFHPNIPGAVRGNPRKKGI